MAHEPIPEGPRGRILQAQLATLLERGRGEDCLELSEINGLITFDRKPKFDVRDIREINGLLR